MKKRCYNLYEKKFAFAKDVKRLSEYVNEGAEVFNEEPEKKGFSVKKLFKYFFLSLVALVYGILIFRMVSASDHKIVKQILADDKFMAAYEQNKENFFVEKYPMKSAWVAIRDNRLVEFNNLYYVPSTNQLQFSVKFNQDLPLCEYDTQPFEFSLVDETGKVYETYWYDFAKKSKWGYVRVCFEDIELIKDGEFDENGIPKRHTYRLDIKMISSSGEYRDLCNYQVYDGNRVSKRVDLSLIKEIHFAK